MTQKLTSEQIKAIRHGEGPLLIIAGAGTGKTTVITERIKYLTLEKNVPLSSILALTFTEKAALEMEERVDKAMPYGYTQAWISTFHSFCDRILRSEAIHIGLSSSFKIMTEPESIIFLKKNLFEFKLNYFRPLGNPNKFLEGLIAHFSRLKDEDISIEEYLNFSENYQKSDNLDIDKEKIKELALAYKAYEDLKAKEAVLDFSDLIANTLKLFRKRPNILKEYQKQFEYVLVDEFQDTNYSQNELAILISGEKQNINVVGDDDQAIYRWRGAAISNILQFKKHFPKTKVVVLTKNFRSTQEILDKSYLLIQNNNPDRLEVKEKIKKKLESARKIKGEEVKFMFTDRVENEAEKVAAEILALSKKYEYKDFAILVRANNHAEPFIRAFERNRIPYQFLGPGQLFRQDEIKDLIAYLKVLYNFEDSVSLYRVLSMENFDINPRDLAAILNFARRQGLSLFEATEKIDEIIVSGETKEKIKKFLEMINRHLKKVRDDTAGQIVYYFLQDSKLLDKFATYETVAEERRAQNIAKFFDRLKTYELEHRDASLPTIVEWIDLSMQMGESPQAAAIDWTGNNAVNILTVHSSKGLEFPVVFLVNLVTGRFPTRERSEQIPLPDEVIKEILPTGDYHLQEERRLFYVGMTRARDHLILSASNYYGEGKRERKISPFVYETLGKTVDEVIKKVAQPSGQLSFEEWAPLKEAPIEPIKKNGSLPLEFLSFSQIETFRYCPLHYKARYVLRIPTPSSHVQNFGISIHQTLRDLHQLIMRNEMPTEKDVLNLFERNWIKEGYADKKHRDLNFEVGKKLLVNYLKSEMIRGKSVYLEFPFKFNLEKDGKILKIAGKIDRVDVLPDGRIEIIDYKTGRDRNDDLSENLQLTLYALAATQLRDPNLNKKPEEIDLALYFLENGEKKKTIRTLEQIEKAKEEIWQIADKISVSDFVCIGSQYCKVCEYQMLCSVKT